MADPIPAGFKEVSDLPPGFSEVQSEPPTQGSRGVLAEWKERLLKEPPAGDPRANPVARTIRALGDFMIPGSYPQAIALGASAIPGVGFLPMLGRAALATSGSAAVEKLRGGDPSAGAIQGATQSLGGEALGAVGRAATRYIGSRLDPTTSNVAKIIGRLVPAFRAHTPDATLARAMSSEGQNALSQQYGAAVDTAITKAGDPLISLAPGYVGPASMLQNLLKSEKRRLFTMARDPARSKDVYQRIDDIHDLEQKLAGAIEKWLPKSDQGVFAKVNAAYRAGKEIQSLFKGAPGRLTSSQERQLVTPEGRLNSPILQSNLLLRSGKLQEALGPEGYAALVRAIRRGETNPLARDVPGVAPHARLHLGFLPTVHGTPHAPRLVGQPELISDIVARTLRRLGTRGTAALTDESDASP